MKILITGAKGLIGKHLVHELNSHDYNVIGIDRQDGDLRSLDIADYLINLHKPDLVIHLAAIVGRLFGEMDPFSTVSTNALATLFIAKACAKYGVKYVYISTSEAYGDHNNKFVTESDLDCLPHNLYGLTKRWGEEVSQLYYNNPQILRLSMPYGPGFPAGIGRAALVTFIWNAINDRELTVYKNSSRAWCWIGDLVSGIRMIVGNGESGLWTVGRDDNETSMLDIAKMSCDIAGKPYSLINEIEPPPAQTLIKRLPNNRLKLIGWKPLVELKEGIKRTYEMVKLYDIYGMPTKEVEDQIRNSYSIL